VQFAFLVINNFLFIAFYGGGYYEKNGSRFLLKFAT